MNFYSVFKHLAFKLDPEQVHNVSLGLLSKAPIFSEFFPLIRTDSRLKLTCNNLTWNFPVGVAAGFDKNAEAIKFFESVGFGALEVGTITKAPQVGNEKPRVFRHTEIDSIRNAMGFPNAGADKIFERVAKTKTKGMLIGSNLGKNKDTTEANTPEEYAYLYEQFAPVSDYLVINISSPNTKGLRSFQKKDLLKPILEAVNEKRNILSKPIFIKIAPDLEFNDLKMICELSKEMGFSGIIATNTTIQHDFGKGGVSGSYIKDISRKIRSQLCEVLAEDKSQTLIGVGGIDSYAEIKEFWKQGGDFTQLYTSFIYKGPQMIVDFQKDMLADIEKYQFKNLQEMKDNIGQVI
jgi:dihydroorotate dehydrogenase